MLSGRDPFGEVPCLLGGVLGQRVVSMSMISTFNLGKEVPWTTLTVMIRAIKQCHLGVSEFYHSQSFKYAARNLPKVSSMQRDPYATANLLETISKDIMYLVHHMSTTNPEF